MRADSIGIFWQDNPIVKEKKVVIKRSPPARIWERDDYLPGLDIAKSCVYPLIGSNEFRRSTFVYDIECYPNYFLVGFKSTLTGEFYYFEMDENKELDRAGLKWMLTNNLTIGFNSIRYDNCITALAVNGASCAKLKEASDSLIVWNEPYFQLLKRLKVKPLEIDHIDLIEVAPLTGSLKMYGGGLHTECMQDLPFKPDKVLSEDQKTIVRHYCLAKDLNTTLHLFNALKEELILRDQLSIQYKMDLRSKSDAQISEAVIGKTYQAIVGQKIYVPEIMPGTSYKYKIPEYIKFKTSILNKLLDFVRESEFVVGESGAVMLPDNIKNLQIQINNSRYTIGKGGLHSCEEKISHWSDSEYDLIDKDVVSYYPTIILNQGLCPKHLDKAFLNIYAGIVDRRIRAKRDNQKTVAASLKIMINGLFGKLGSRYSRFYSPDLLFQVTMSGQLSLLLLIETLELKGIPVVSANTDGIVSRVLKSRKSEFDAIVKDWEKKCSFETEETIYKCLLSRDVNNYIALKSDGTIKSKGAYAKASLSKNPTNNICVVAIEELLSKNVPIEQTIRACTDIREFITVRKVKGGAVKIYDHKMEYLGGAIRWYYGKDETGEIVYAQSGNKVPKSDGAIPIMDLPDKFPDNVDHEWYIEEAKKMLADCDVNLYTESTN